MHFNVEIFTNKFSRSQILFVEKNNIYSWIWKMKGQWLDVKIIKYKIINICKRNYCMSWALIYIYNIILFCVYFGFIHDFTLWHLNNNSNNNIIGLKYWLTSNEMSIKIILSMCIHLYLTLNKWLNWLTSE